MAITFLTLLGIILIAAIVGLGISIYMIIQGGSSYNMELFGVIASSVFIVFTLFSITVVSVDGFYLDRYRIEMSDFKFLLDIDIKQFSMSNENILLYSPELVTNQIVPRYLESPYFFLILLDLFLDFF